MRSIQFFLPFILFTCHIILPSCGAKRKIKQPINVSEKSTIKEYLNEAERTFFWESIHKNTPFNYLSFQTNTDFKNSENNYSFKTNIRLKNDSIVWISVRVLSIEIARVIAKTDSVFVKINNEKKMVSGSWVDISNKIGYHINLPMFQDILLGNPVLSDSCFNNSYIQKNDAGFKLNSICAEDSSSKSFKITLETDSVFNVKSQVLENIEGTNKALISIIEYTHLMFDSVLQKMPLKINYEIIMPEKSTILTEYSKFETTEVEFPFSVPSKYERVQF